MENIINSFKSVSNGYVLAIDKLIKQCVFNKKLPQH